ncbi:MAG: 50S ribosomal protein L24 [Candidatus Aenigmarchaeota archaeon]|nr:50S ribosomal protein L24 [Candidatus Aenigmarchaeota archaeon]
MKTKSSQPRKQRKRLYESPLHRRQKLVSASLDKKLRKEFNRRSMPLRKGDKVEVMRGSFKGIRSIVKKIDLKKLRVTLEDVKRKKVDGTEVHVPIHPSNLKIIEPDMTDKKRQKIVERVKGKFEVKKKEKVKKEESKEEKTKGYKCPYCGKVFNSKTELNEHEMKEHKEYTKVV